MPVNNTTLASFSGSKGAGGPSLTIAHVTIVRYRVPFAWSRRATNVHSSWDGNPLMTSTALDATSAHCLPASSAIAPITCSIAHLGS